MNNGIQEDYMFQKDIFKLCLVAFGFAASHPALLSISDPHFENQMLELLHCDPCL